MLAPALHANVQVRLHRVRLMAREAAEQESPKQHPRMCVVVSSSPHMSVTSR